MCLAVVGLDVHPDFAVVIAANRDEQHARPTAPAQWWPEGWLAGRDLAGGGTWLGVTDTGRWALLTNVREPARKNPDAPTRGTLVTRVLADAAPPDTSLDTLVSEVGVYNGFNLLAGTPHGGAWLSNRSDGPRRLARGIHGISNAVLDSPWPKVIAAKAALDRWCADGARAIDPLFDALASRAIAPDHALPATGVKLEIERRLSAAFILDDGYGTRSSTVVLIGRDGRCSFEERSFDAKGNATGSARFAFSIGRRAGL